MMYEEYCMIYMIWLLICISYEVIKYLSLNILACVREKTNQTIFLKKELIPTVRKNCMMYI